MHGWEFDLKTGHCKNIPGQEVCTYAVRIVDGDVQVAVEN
jgi:nitrite reductase/ring-hydroxylating ferredoxin subunit